MTAFAWLYFFTLIPAEMTFRKDLECLLSQSSSKRNKKNWCTLRELLLNEIINEYKMENKLSQSYKQY